MTVTDLFSSPRHRARTEDARSGWAPVPAAPAPAPTRRLDSLAAVTRAVAGRPELWRPLVHFDRGERRRVRLDGPPGVDVWLLTWLRTHGTDLHDHGEAAAAFTVVRGTLTQVTPDADRRLVPTRITGGLTQTVEPGVVHDVANEHAEPAVSIHAYSPRLERMTYYAAVAGLLLPTRTVLAHEPHG